MCVCAGACVCGGVCVCKMYLWTPYSSKNIQNVFIVHQMVPKFLIQLHPMLSSIFKGTKL